MSNIGPIFSEVRIVGATCVVSTIAAFVWATIEVGETIYAT